MRSKIKFKLFLSIIVLGLAIFVFNGNVFAAANNNHYYNQLTNDIGRSVYNALKTDTTGAGYVEVTITPATFPIDSAIINDAEALRTRAGQIAAQEFKPYIVDAIVSFDMDNPEKYWYFNPGLNYRFDINRQENTITFTTIELYSYCDERNDINTFNSRINQIANSITGSSNAEIVKNIHDYICNNVTYEQMENTEIDQTAYTAAVLNKGVCEAQAKLFKILSEKKGIPCLFIAGFGNQGNGEEAHAWNYVYLTDTSKWYAVDTTWDNRHKYNEEPLDKYLLVGSDTSITVGSSTTTFGENHNPGIKVLDIQTYVPAAPTLSSTSYQVDASAGTDPSGNNNGNGENNNNGNGENNNNNNSGNEQGNSGGNSQGNNNSNGNGGNNTGSGTSASGQSHSGTGSQGGTINRADNTTAKIPIPQAGIKSIMSILIIFILAISVVYYTKYKKIDKIFK